jgi:hypothetical protein
MLDLNYLSQEDKGFLTVTCREFLNQTNTPLVSHSQDNIILQAVQAGFELEEYESLFWKQQVN